MKQLNEMNDGELLDRANELREEEIELHRQLAMCMMDQNDVGRALVRRLNERQAGKPNWELPEGKLFVPPRRQQ
jgi:ribosomal protein L29